MLDSKEWNCEKFHSLHDLLFYEQIEFIKR